MLTNIHATDYWKINDVFQYETSREWGEANNSNMLEICRNVQVFSEKHLKTTKFHFVFPFLLL